ncbi:MAG: chemotaxis protein CheX [Treponema sp.]|nr:chemotaxis protein CheX [Treponema sp.]
MRVEYINPFVKASFRVLKDVLGGADIKRGDLYLKSTAMPVMGVAVLVGLAGDVEGRVLLDMTLETAINLASVMNGEKLPSFDDLGKSTISELANLITGQFVTMLHELNFQVDITPPTLFVGQQMEISALSGSTNNVEALIVPLITEYGKIEINVAIREKDRS